MAHVALGGHHEDGQGGGAGAVADGDGRGVAVHDGHHHVQDDEVGQDAGIVRGVHAQGAQGFLAVDGGGDGVPGLLQDEAHQGDDVLLVVDDEYPGHEGNLYHIRLWPW